MVDKLKKVSLICVLLIVMTACGKSNQFDQSMQKTKEAIIEKKFEEAEGFVEQALESKPKNTEAKQYQSQLKLYIGAKEYADKKDYDKALANLDSVISTKNGSSKLIEYAKKDKKDIASKKDSAKKEDSKDEEKTSEKESDKKALWDESKKDSLRGFMVKFSHTMGQNYKEYNRHDSVDLYGVSLPADILNDEWKMAVNNQAVQVEWSDNGLGNAPYQLVAVYSDADTQPYMQKHVYFFVIEDGQPKVYVTQQNQGNDKNYMYFTETQNAEIKQGFSQIVEGNSPSSTTDNKQSNVTYENNKMLAAKVLIKMSNLSADELLSKNITYSLYQNNPLQIWETGVYLPEDVTIISGHPLAAGMFTYHNNGDGTVTQYPVPSHYHDKAWSDPVKGKELANKVISDAKIIDITDVSDEAAQNMMRIIDNDI